MTPDDIDALLRSGPDRSLDGLENAVWDGLAAQRLGERRLRTLASVQTLLGLLAVLGSAAIGGVLATQAMAEPPTLGVFSPHMALAPSSRLAGGHL